MQTRGMLFADIAWRFHDLNEQFYFHIKWTQELESQAINVLHPRNRKFPPTQLLAETHNPMTLGNEILSKNTNASRHHGTATNERQLAQESENPHRIQKSKTNDEIQKQA